ncbi:hypothetical protein BGW37DRAFT_118495 [Umbelopsis sp. PMI_123]|nr:hypothetical protein BGW37DRAFT_118495 [Umbelopsis sp. PMI_123]
MDITEEGLIVCFTRHEHFEIMKRRLNLRDNATPRDLRNHAKSLKDDVISKLLFRMDYRHGYQANAQAVTSSETKRYVLTGTFRTNGDILQVLAFDTSKDKKEYQKQKDNILPKIEDVFLDRDAVRAEFSEPKSVKVIDIDLGEVLTVAACYNDYPGALYLTIKRKALYQPTLKARYEREHRKTRLVYRTESLIPMSRN